MNEEERWSDEREVRIDAEPERVWQAWAEPEHIARWFADEATGDLEPGAELVHSFRDHGEHRYRVVEVAAPRRLVLQGEMDGVAFRQEVRIEREGGATVLRLIHSGFGKSDPDSDIVQGIDSGWTLALALFKHYVERWFGRPKATLSLFRPAPYDYSELFETRYASGLETWLVDDNANGEEARLRSGISLTGPELVRSKHELSRAWAEVDGVLELKAFGVSPEMRFLGVRVTSWSDDADAWIERLRPELEAAVQRLVAQVSA